MNDEAKDYAAELLLYVGEETPYSDRPLSLEDVREMVRRKFGDQVANRMDFKKVTH